MALRFLAFRPPRPARDRLRACVSRPRPSGGGLIDLQTFCGDSLRQSAFGDAGDQGFAPSSPRRRVARKKGRNSLARRCLNYLLSGEVTRHERIVQVRASHEIRKLRGRTLLVVRPQDAPPRERGEPFRERAQHLPRCAPVLGIWISVVTGWAWLAVLSRHLYRVSPNTDCERA